MSDLLGGPCQRGPAALWPHVCLLRMHCPVVGLAMPHVPQGGNFQHMYCYVPMSKQGLPLCAQH